jgi:hypothetical protein
MLNPDEVTMTRHFRQPFSGYRVFNRIQKWDSFLVQKDLVAVDVNGTVLAASQNLTGLRNNLSKVW